MCFCFSVWLLTSCLCWATQVPTSACHPDSDRYCSHFLFLLDPKPSHRCSCPGFLLLTHMVCSHLGLPCDTVSLLILNLQSLTLVSLSQLLDLTFNRREWLCNSTLCGHTPLLFSFLKKFTIIIFLKENERKREKH